MKSISLGLKITGLIVTIFLIWGGLSGNLVLRGTESSIALAGVGFLFLIWDIYLLVTHKKKWIVKVKTGKKAPEPVINTTSDSKPVTPIQGPQMNKIIFVREDRDSGNIWRIHKASCKADAVAYLSTHPVKFPFYYIVVETPEGNFGRDINGFYQE